MKYRRKTVDLISQYTFIKKAIVQLRIISCTVAFFVRSIWATSTLLISYDTLSG